MDKNEVETQWRKLFAKQLRVVMAEQDIKGSELAEMTGIPNSLIYQYRRGEVTPKTFNLVKICRVLNVDANKLLGIRRDDAK